MSKKLILIRHAERPDISEGEVGNDVLLTAAGKRASFNFGQTLKQEIIDIKSSPIDRCVQTATEIAKAVNFNQSNITTCTDLGAPGYIISDGKKAWGNWQEKGGQAVKQFLLDGKERWDGFYDLSEATQTFTQKIKSTLMNSPHGTHVWVTHDTVLAALTSRVLESPITEDQWPGYLGHLSIELSDSDSNTLTFRYSPD